MKVRRGGRLSAAAAAAGGKQRRLPPPGTRCAPVGLSVRLAGGEQGPTARGGAAYGLLGGAGFY